MERKDVLRTDKMIQDAYMGLIFSCGDKKITVNDVISKAGISRSTFYAHYQDLPDLDRSVEKRITDYVKSFIVNTTPEELISNSYEKLSPLLHAVFERKELLHGLIIGGWKPLVLKNIRAAFDGAIDWSRLQNVSAEKIETMHQCIRGVLMETCYYWSMCDDPMDEEILIRTACDFISAGLKNIISQVK